MRIGAIGNQNQLFHVNRLNQSAARINGTAGSIQQQDRDKLALSPQGKKQDLLSNLMKQRQSIMERKGELKAANAEKGGSMSEIQSQLDLMDEQLKNIDEQIAKAQAEELKTEEKDQEGKIYDKPRTEEEIKNQQLSDITDLATGIEAMEVISSAKDKADGEVRVLKAEIKSGFGNIEKKIEKVSELSTKSNDLLEQLGEHTGAVNEAASEVNNAEANIEPDSSPEEVIPAKPDSSEALLKQEKAEEENQEA